MRNLLIAVLLLMGIANPLAAQSLKDENLIVSMPIDYKVGMQVRRGNMLMTEMLPKDQDIKNWSELLTVQIFFGMKQSPQNFRDGMLQSWKQACPDYFYNPSFDGVENGYPTAFFMLHCPSSQHREKMELTILKVISGNDSLYVVQKAWSVDPDKQGIEKWSRFLRRVKVCDTRLPDRPC